MTALAGRLTGGRMPVLWLCGPAGVGKSTVSWQLFTELTRSGVPAAFADTDQLCMCYPAPVGDPGRERIKAQTLDAMIANYRAAGARCLIVNGVVDPAAGVLRALLPHAALTVCRLRADRDEIARRFAARHGNSSDLDELIADTLTEAEQLDASDFADACVDTTGLPASKVAALVRDRCGDWPGFHASVLRPSAASVGPSAAVHLDTAGSQNPDGDILLICGPTGVGKSTIGFQLHLSTLRGGRTCGYVDLDQLAFIRPGASGDPGHHQLKARNLAAIWQTYHAAGARHVVATGPVHDAVAFRRYAEALPGTTITLCRLHAGRAELTRRVLSRGAGGSWPQPGDPLRGQPDAYLRQVADQAAADAESLERARFGMLRIDTDGRTPAEAADLIAAATGWPG
jgi:adenylylsulfate kinase-like enzyme